MAGINIQIFTFLPGSTTTAQSDLRYFTIINNETFEFWKYTFQVEFCMVWNFSNEDIYLLILQKCELFGQNAIVRMLTFS